MRLTDVFNAKAVAMNWETFVADSNAAPYLGEGFFPVRKKAGLDLKFIKGASGLPIALKPSAFDAHAKLRDRIGLTTLQTEMPFFREGFLVSEQDRQDILRAQDSADPYVAQALQNIYQDSQNLIAGANVIPERMRMQLLAPADGELGISISADGASYEYEYDAADAWKGTNYKALTSTAMWSDTEHSDPIKDIEDAQEAIEDATGVRPDTLILNKATMRYLRENENIHSYIQSKSVSAIVRYTSQMIKDYIFEELGVTVIEYNKKYLTEKGGTAQKFYPDDYATLLPSAPVGETWYGTTPEEADFIAGQGDSMALVNTGVAVAVVHQNHPVTAETIASEIVLPSFEGMDKVYVLKVHTAASGDE